MRAKSIRTAVLILGASLSTVAIAGGARGGFGVGSTFGPPAPIAAPVFTAPVTGPMMAPVTGSMQRPAHHVPGGVRPPLAPVFFRLSSRDP